MHRFYSIKQSEDIPVSYIAMLAAVLCYDENHINMQIWDYYKILQNS